MVRCEPSSRWVRAELDGVVVADSRRALLVWDGASYPATYAVPEGDLAAAVVAARVEGDREVLDLRVGDRVLAGAAWQASGVEGLADAVVLDWHAMDRWREEDEVLFRHPRDPAVRVDALPSSRHVRVAVDGVVVAESRRPVLVFETNLPMRTYLPPGDVRLDLLEPSATRSACPYKGEASYRSIRLGDALHEDLVWTYDDPVPAVAGIRGLLAFYDEKVDVEIDGEPQARPVTAWS
jgi:uncharacterized protein (DUF427 family)